MSSTTATAVKLFGTPFSTCSQRVLLAANELGIKLELVNVDLSKGEHKSEAHVKRQPFGKVPAIEDGDFSLYESRAIVLYLIRKYGSSSASSSSSSSSSSSALLPAASDAQGWARFDQFSSLEATTVNPEIININVQKFWGVYSPGFVYSQQKVDDAVKALELPLDVLDKHLSTSQFLAGNTYSALDIIFTPYTSLVFDKTEEGKALLAKRPNLAAYWKRITERNSWQQVQALLAPPKA